MADCESKNENTSILYELLVLSEWIEDHDSVISKIALNSTAQESASYFNPWKLLSKCKLNNVRFLETEYPWHLAVSKDGKVIAVLQESLLEIRTAKDEYLSVVGKAIIPSDQCPNLRKLSWSLDNSFLALARDNGVILVFNLFGCNVASVEPPEKNAVLQPVVGLCFLQSKFDSAKWSNELLIVYHRGHVKSILLSHLDGFEPDVNIKQSLEYYYPEGISAVAYNSHNLLLLAGPPSGSECGVTVWRVLNDYPYLKTALDSEKNSKSSRSFLRLLPGFSNQSNPKTISTMRTSPDEKLLACIDFSGEISLWRLPAILLYRKWSLHEQPQYNRVNPQKKKESMPADESFYPVDISWWSNSALVIVRRNGALSVCTVTTLDNILGDSPEFLASSPQISSIVGERSEVIALECETSFKCQEAAESGDSRAGKENETSALQESIQATLYSFTDIEMFEPKRRAPKIRQRTYRLLALKRTTPEELYARKIDHEEYEEALLLAKKYNLDCDLVYQKRWRNSLVSKESINNYLDKVKKTLWVIKECLDRVPESLEDAKELLVFGLRKTELTNVRTDDLSAEQKQQIFYRRRLLRFLDNLTVYQKIIGSPGKYNSADYDSFRKKPALAATVNFAREENWQAVSIMFTYAGEKVLPHWLSILSNFPETLRPVVYRSLLPEVVGQEVIPWEMRELRKSDWSEESPFECLCPEGSGDGEEICDELRSSLKEFESEKLTAGMVEGWYRKRAYEIENCSGLVENALALVVLARERGIKTLNQLHNDLLTLDALVYRVGDYSISLTKLEALTHLDQCKLLLSKTLRNSFVEDLKNLIVPFAKRCQQQNCHSPFVLLRDLLLHFSESSLEFPLELLTYLKNGHLNPLNLTVSEMAAIGLDCIYACPREDQLETCFLILECLPQRENSTNVEDSDLHDRIDRLEIHLEVCDLLHRYKTPKCVRYVFENENKVDVGKELMESMADYTKRESLDFVELLSDLQFLQTKVFVSIPSSFCYELCALSQMSCECEELIQSVEWLIECRRGEKDKMVPFERSVELVLEAARNHFERATNFDDYSIHLAQTCLRLIGEPQPKIYEELDLIEAVQLLGDFHVKVLPLQVRKHERRIELIECCLKAKPKNYKACQRLLQLAQTLRIYGDDRPRREGEVLVMIAKHAWNCADYQCCSEVCDRLVTRNFSPAWSIVRLLAETVEYEHKSNKKLFLAFAILHCPVESLENLIESRIELHEKYFQ